MGWIQNRGKQKTIERLKELDITIIGEQTSIQTGYVYFPANNKAPLIGAFHYFTKLFVLSGLGENFLK